MIEVVSKPISVRYKSHLLTVGNDVTSQKTEIMDIDRSSSWIYNGLYIWSFVETDFQFTPGSNLHSYSLITIPSSDVNEEYVLLIGGWSQNYDTDFDEPLDTIFKFNDTWSHFGRLNKPRYDHSSIYWNGAVYVIGGLPSVKSYSDLDFSVDYLIENGDRVNELVEEYMNAPFRTKIEIWNIKDSPDQFRSTENWPELFEWRNPHLFIVPDSFFPDY